MESITIYGVGKFRDDIMTINSAEAALLLIELTKALNSDKSHIDISMPIALAKNTES